MSLCIAEQVAAALKTKLDNVVTDGYAAEAYRLARAGLPTSPGHQSLYLLADDPAGVGEEDEAQGYKTWVQEFVVLCYARPADGTTTPIDTTLNELRARVEKELTEDITLGGLALNLLVMDPAGFENSAEGWSAIGATIQVTYRHLETNPYSQ